MKKEKKITNNILMSSVSYPLSHFTLFSLFFFLFSFYIFGQESKYFHASELLTPLRMSAPEINSHAAILIDAETDKLLYYKNAQEEISPASLTKLMTMHLMMKEINEGRASYNEIIPITEESWAQNQPPRSSLMFLAPGQIVTIREILTGLAVSSGNDAAVAIALRLAPSVENFSSLMTAEARKLGLDFTYFVEPSGISEYNMTTAEEFVYFCNQYIKLHPNALKDFHSVLEFGYPLAHNVAERYRNNPRTITQGNRNGLLYNFPGVDGLKTGYIDESGYNFALTAERNSTRFIAVTFGAESARYRDRDGRALLTWAFENFKTVRPVIDQLESPRLWKGKEKSAEVKLANSAYFTSPLNRANTINYSYEFLEPLIAPITEGTIVGDLIISDDYGELKRIPLTTTKDYKKGNIFKRLWHSIRLLFIKY